MKGAARARSRPPEVLQLAEVPKPVPRVQDLLVRVAAFTVTIGNRHLRGYVRS